MEIFFLLLISGVLAGKLGGVLGIGGGILMMPVLRFIVGLSPAYAAGTCIIAVFFTTLGGSYKHYKKEHINVRSIIPVIISGAVSTTIFSFMFLHFTSKPEWLDLGTGLVFSLISVRMIIEGVLDQYKKTPEKSDLCKIKGSLTGKSIIGVIAGVLPGLLGIGTGAILVPAFTLIMKAPIKIAIGSSLACFSVNALISSLLKLSQEFVSVETVIPLCIGTFFGSRIGVELNKRFPAPLLKIIFGSLFTYVAIKYFILFLGG